MILLFCSYLCSYSQNSFLIDRGGLFEVGHTSFSFLLCLCWRSAGVGGFPLAFPVALLLSLLRPVVVDVIGPFSVSLLVPKKVELLIRVFEPFWISRVFYFSLRTFGEVAGHPGPLVASDET